jgi:hypothetical protein
VVFDLNCLFTYRSFFGSLSVVASPDLVVVWRGRTPPGVRPGGRAAAVTEVLRRDEAGWSEAVQEHRQRHHPEPAVRAAAAAAGLRILGVHGIAPDGSMHEGLDELSDSKAVYVAAQDQSPGRGTRGT